MQTQNKKYDIDKLKKEVDEIVETIDVKSASLLLKEISSLLSEKKIEIGNELEDILLKLKIIDFPGISDTDAENLVTQHLLLFFMIDVPFEQRLLARYAFCGTTEKNIQRKLIKKAILKNQERLGKLKIGEWIEKFQEKYKNEQQKDQNIINFFSEEKEALSLEEAAKSILKSILHTYITYIDSDIIDIFDVAMLWKNISKNPSTKLRSKNEYFSKLRDGEMTEIYSPINQKNSMKNSGSNNDNHSIQIENLPIQKAIAKFPSIKDQIITSQKIYLSKNSENSVTPTVKNWLTDYTYKLGFKDHSSIQRGAYLFKDKNTQNLNQSEKDRLGVILKSFDEKTPLQINREQQKIIFFSNVSPLVNPRSLSNKKPDNIRTTDHPDPDENIPQNVQNEKFDFHQKMPFEKKMPPFRITPNFTRKQTSSSSQQAASKQSRDHAFSPNNKTIQKQSPQKDFPTKFNLVSGSLEKSSGKNITKTKSTQINPNNVVDLKNSK